MEKHSSLKKLVCVVSVNELFSTGILIHRDILIDNFEIHRGEFTVIYRIYMDYGYFNQYTATNNMILSELTAMN